MSTSRPTREADDRAGDRAAQQADERDEQRREVGARRRRPRPARRRRSARSTADAGRAQRSAATTAAHRRSRSRRAFAGAPACSAAASRHLRRRRGCAGRRRAVTWTRWYERRPPPCRPRSPCRSGCPAGTSESQAARDGAGGDDVSPLAHACLARHELQQQVVGVARPRAARCRCAVRASHAPRRRLAWSVISVTTARRRRPTVTLPTRPSPLTTGLVDAHAVARALVDRRPSSTRRSASAPITGARDRVVVLDARAGCRGWQSRSQLP